MRIVTCIIILYACLSIFAPGLAFISCFETTALLFYQPWDLLFDLLGLDQGVEGTDPGRVDPDSVQGGEGPVEFAHHWWSGIARIPQSSGRYGMVGARSVEPIRAGQKRIIYYVGPSSPVRPRDPLVLGDALVGFVDDFEPSDRVPVLLLNHKDSRSVKGKVTGTVAGGQEVFFVAGGASQVIEGCLRIQLVNDSFGIEEGSRAFTDTVPLTPRVPPGLFLGEVRIRKKLDEVKRDAALEPPFPPERLSRAAILVPPERLGGRERLFLPAVGLAHFPVRVRFIVRGRGRRIHLGILPGLEGKLQSSDQIVIDGFVAGIIDRVGLFSAFGSLLLSKGDDAHAAVFPAGEGPRYFSFKVLEQTGLFFKVEAGEPLEGLAEGMPVFLAGRPCSALESYPAFRVSDPGDGKTFCLEVPWSGAISRSFCVSTRLAQ